MDSGAAELAGLRELGELRRFGEELVAEEAGVALPAVGVEDPELRPPSRRAGPVPGDHHLRSLSDHVTAETDPAPPRELEAQAGRLADRGPEGGRRRRRLEEDEERVRPARESGQAMEPVRHAGRPGGRVPTRIQARRQVHDEEVDGPAGEERGGDRPALVEILRRDDDEPLEPDPAGNRLDRVEAAAGIQPGHDRARRLGLRDEPQGERGLAAPTRAAEGERGRSRHAARAQDRVECREPRRDDAVRRPERRPGVRVGGKFGWQRRGGQGTDHLADRLTGAVRPLPRSCAAPPRLEGRESRRHVRGEARHRMDSIEQMFGIVNGLGAVGRDSPASQTPCRGSSATRYHQ